jgi:glutathione synthase/RimK-type ligase-like ATP-grasp enzyme
MLKAVGVYREVSLAGKPEADMAILDATAAELRKFGFDVSVFHPDKIPEDAKADLVFSMARSAASHARIAKLGARVVVNSLKSISDSLNRELSYSLLEKAGVPIPGTRVVAARGSDWPMKKLILKRPDRHEFTKVAATEEEFNRAMDEYIGQGVERVVAQDFVEGMHVKYYTIGNEAFLADDAESRLPADVVKRMKIHAVRAGEALGLRVFGGDFMVDGQKAFLVDLNDWPTFSPMREEAARKIAALLARELETVA